MVCRYLAVIALSVIIRIYVNTLTGYQPNSRKQRRTTSKTDKEKQETKSIMSGASERAAARDEQRRLAEALENNAREQRESREAERARAQQEQAPFVNERGARAYVGITDGINSSLLERN